MNLLRRLSAFVLRLFFRRVSIAGLENIPSDAPVLFAPNHPNSLVDPLFLMAFAPRGVVFLAKEPLFRMPIVGRLVRAAGAIPVYRKQDQADMTRNHETFAQVRTVLGRGGAVAIFPEGVSHNDPQLRPFKTGAARMALGATAVGAADRPVQIIPTGLYYTRKATFRSSALVYFGTPLTVPVVPLDARGEPAPEAVRLLTARLATALAEVTLQADQHEALALITRVQRIYASAALDANPEELVDQFAMRQRFLAGYSALRERNPQRLAELQGMTARYEAKLAAAGLSPESVPPTRIDGGRVVRYALGSLLGAVVMLPLALTGIIIHWPAYRLIGPLAAGFAKERDLIATVKILVSALAFPLTWGVLALVVRTLAGGWWALVALLVMPLTGYLALRFLERLDRIIGSSRALALLLLRPIAFQRLVAERRKIREAIIRTGNEMVPEVMPANVTR